MLEVYRCQYLKADGIQCGSPALRDHIYCYFHNNWRESELHRLRGEEQSPFPIGIPDLEDPNAIQGAFTEVMRLMLTDQIDDRRAGLLLYALQTAAVHLDQLWYSDAAEDIDVAREIP